MSRWLLLLPLLVMGGGCSGSEDVGALPPPTPPVTKEKLAEMPAEARRMAESAARQGESQGSAMDKATREMKEMQARGGAR